jgi:hypothetical protein
MEDPPEAGFQQPNFSMISPESAVASRGIEAIINYGQILVIVMGVSFGINDYIEGGVVTAVILLNIVVG